MTHPNPGPQPGPQQYPGQPLHPGQPQPGQQYPGQPFPGQPFPGQPQPGRPFPGQQPFPGQPYPGQQYPGQPYPGQPHPGGPRPPGKAMSVVAALLYLPGVLLALVGSIGLATRAGFAFDLWGAILMPPFPRGYSSFGVMSAVSFVLPVLALVLAVLLLSRVPGVRWGLAAISLLAVVHFGLVLARIDSSVPPSAGITTLVALVLWLVPGVIAILPPVGRAMRGAKPKAPNQPAGFPMAGPPMAGPPPGAPGPPPAPGQWG